LLYEETPMPSPRYHVILPLPLGQQVEALAMESGQGLSAVIRRCVELALHAPELRVMLEQEGPAVLTDTRTPEQIRAWADYQSSHAKLDHGMLLT
jgi:hypothetical protein